MKVRPYRLTVLALMMLVALCALGLGGYRAYERRRECLARARRHEEGVLAYRVMAENSRDMERDVEKFAAQSRRYAASLIPSTRQQGSDQLRRDEALVARHRAQALSDECYAQFHERMKKRYLDLARHPWRRLPKDDGSADAELVASLEAIARQEPSNGRSHENLGSLWARKNDYARALAEYELAIKCDDSLTTAYYDCAWLLATCPDARFRDGQRAIALATRACELKEWKKPDLLETLAAAYAETGQFDAALEWQTKAIELLEKGSNNREELERLRLYQAKKPFREQRNRSEEN